MTRLTPPRPHPPTAANIPVTDGLVGHYYAPSYDEATRIWGDSTPGFTQNPATAYSTTTPQLGTMRRRGIDIEYVYGPGGTGFRFPQAYNESSRYTMFYVCRWAGGSCGRVAVTAWQAAVAGG